MNPLLIAILNLSTGFLAGVLSIPLLTRGVGQNQTYGFRLREAFQSDEAWYAINAHGGKWMLIWSAVIVAIGAVFLIAHFNESLPPESGWSTLAALAPCLLLVSGVQTILWAGKHFPVAGDGEKE